MGWTVTRRPQPKSGPEQCGSEESERAREAETLAETARLALSSSPSVRTHAGAGAHVRVLAAAAAWQTLAAKPARQQTQMMTRTVTGTLDPGNGSLNARQSPMLFLAPAASPPGAGAPLQGRP